MPDKDQTVTTEQYGPFGKYVVLMCSCSARCLERQPYLPGRPPTDFRCLRPLVKRAGCQGSFLEEFRLGVATRRKLQRPYAAEVRKVAKTELPY